MSKYFDFHIHPAFKNHLSNYDQNLPKITGRKEDYTQPIKLTNVIINVMDDLILHILKSQSSIQQCQEINLHYAVAALSNLEFGFADSQGIFGGVLRSNFSNPLDKKYFDKVRNGEISYYRIMLMELSIYRHLDQIGSINFISRNSTKKESSTVPNILLSLEGSHNFSKYLVGNVNKLDYEKDRIINHHPKKMLSEDSIWKELVSTKSNCNEINPAKNNDTDCYPPFSQDPAVNFENFYKSLSRDGMDLLYLTLTHLTYINEQNLATHAFGMKMLKHPSFYPFGNGITASGYRILEKCYKMTNHKNEPRPILIDLKHLGLKSRQDIYKYRAKLTKAKYPIGTIDYAKIPLIASHVAVTGYSYNEWSNALKKDSCTVYNYKGARAVSVEMKRKECGKWGSFVNNDFSFNPWSINLLDEDIVEVLKSGGLIGMSLDVRVLGFQSAFGINMADDNEYLSTADFQTHFPEIPVKNLPVKTVESAVAAEESWLVPTKEDRHPLIFCFNIIHIIQVGILKAKIEKPWLQISIGSDFDGLIEPLKISPNINSLDELEANINKWLLVAEAGYVEQNGGKTILAGKTPKEFSEIVQGIMSSNGIQFIKKWQNNFQ